MEKYQAASTSGRTHNPALFVTSEEDGAGWSNLHDLALLYLALMHGADAEIDPTESSVMRQKLHAWCPEPLDDQLKGVLSDVMLVYMGESGRQMLETSVASLRESLPKGKRIAILNDLAEIASADGMIVPGEVSFIQQLAQLWDIEKDLQ